MQNKRFAILVYLLNHIVINCMNNVGLNDSCYVFNLKAQYRKSQDNNVGCFTVTFTTEHHQHQTEDNLSVSNYGSAWWGSRNAIYLIHFHCAPNP